VAVMMTMIALVEIVQPQVLSSVGKK